MIDQPSREAVREAGRVLAEARVLRDSLPVAEAARQAFVPGGPSLAEIEAQIRTMRGLPLGPGEEDDSAP